LAGLADQVVFTESGRLGMPESALTAMALGCDTVNVAREAMLAIGCIQAQRCHTDKCPVGIATHSGWRTRGLDPAIKSVRLASYICTLRHELLELSHACGALHPNLVGADRIEILDGHFGCHTLRGTFGYEPSWTATSPAERLALEELMHRSS
jgi:glutamate synthase domain-containing protein 2